MDATVNLIRKFDFQYDIFTKDDQGLLLRIACVESNYGNDTDTFRDGYYGGIWQVNVFNCNL